MGKISEVLVPQDHVERFTHCATSGTQAHGVTIRICLRQSGHPVVGVYNGLPNRRIKLLYQFGAEIEI